MTLAPISIGQAVLAGGLVFLAVLAERFFGFELGRRQWIGIGLVAVALSLLALTAGGGSGAHSDYSLAGMIIFEGVAVGVGALLVLSHLIERVPVQRGVLLGIAAGLGFGISDAANGATRLSAERDKPTASTSPLRKTSTDRRSHLQPASFPRSAHRCFRPLRPRAPRHSRSTQRDR